MMFNVITKGDWSNIFDFLKKTYTFEDVLHDCGREGVNALRNATPINTGLASSSWSYKVRHEGDGVITIEWHNSDIEGGYNVALLIQYGHGTGTGGYVAPVDYINPALKPVFDSFTERIMKEVNKKK